MLLIYSYHIQLLLDLIDESYLGILEQENKLLQYLDDFYNLAKKALSVVEG